MKAKLRDYQVRACDGVRASWAAGHRAPLLVAPTGAGKTTMGAALAADGLATGGRVLWVAHRRELVAQARARLALETAGASARVEVASIQALLAGGDRPPADLVVLDEAHHYVAAQWGLVARDYDDARVLGLTATPQRGDGTPLGDLFTDLVVAAQPAELIRAKALVPVQVYAPDAHQGGDLARGPAEAWERFGRGRRTVVFAADRDEARRAVDDLARAGARPAYVDGKTSARARVDALEGFEAGRYDALVNVHVLTEGWDCPPADVCILARPCATVGQYIQIVGRVLRAHPGKRSALLVDLVGACHTHGHPTADRAYSLEGSTAIRAGAAERATEDEERSVRAPKPRGVSGSELRLYVPSGRVCLSDLVTHGSETLTVKEWAARVGLKAPTLAARLSRNPDVAAALRAHLGANKGRRYQLDGVGYSVAELARLAGVSRSKMAERLKKMSPEDAVKAGKMSRSEAGRKASSAASATNAQAARRLEMNGAAYTSAELSRIAGVSRGIILKRLKKMSPEDAVKAGKMSRSEIARASAEAKAATARRFEMNGASYTVAQLAAMASVHKETMRNWLKTMIPEDAVAKGRA
jgi:DNA repair protein RadD